MKTSSSINTKAPKWERGAHNRRTTETVLEESIEKVFPLFCPVREYEYMRNWSCTIKHSPSGSGYAEKNVIFQTQYSLPFFLEATWVCTKCEPNTAITYTVFVPGKIVLLMENTFTSLTEGKTSHTLTMSGFGLSGFGNFMIKKCFQRRVRIKLRNFLKMNFSTMSRTVK